MKDLELTPQEVHVMKLLSDGLSYRKIGLEFDVTGARVGQIARKARRKIDLAIEEQRLADTKQLIKEQEDAKTS